MMGKRLDLTNKKFGKLSVIAFLECRKTKYGTYSVWTCLCDCGNTINVRGAALKSGHTTSCRCSNRLSEGESGFNTLYRVYKYNAKTRNLVFNLTKKEFKKLTSDKCYYCNEVPKLISSNYSKVGYEKAGVTLAGYENGKYLYNGIDRIDNNLGYTTNNCVTCCKICNEWKKASDQNFFLSQVRKIYENHSY